MVDAGAELGQDDHRKLQPLGAVHGHHAHHVVVGLRQVQVALAAALSLARTQPAHEGPQRIRLVDRELGGAVHDRAQVGNALALAAGNEQRFGQKVGADGAVDQERQRQLALGIVQLRQPAQGLAHRGVRETAGQEAEGSVLEAMLQQVDVGAAECGGLQRRQQGDLIARIVDGAQDRGQIVDLLVLEEVAPAVDDVGYADARQFVGIQSHRGTRLNQDADIAQRNGAYACRVVLSRADLPLGITDQIRDQPRYGARFGQAQVAELGPLQERLGIHHHYPRLGSRRPERVNRLILRLRSGEPGVGLEHTCECRVHPIGELRQRAEVLRHRIDARPSRRLPAVHLLGAQVGVDIGPPEAIDRLLRIADNEQLARLQRYLLPARLAACNCRRIIGGEQKHHLRLQWVGVLEFVHEQEPEPLAQLCPHPAVAGDQCPCLDQQIVEVELAGAPPRRCRVGHERTERDAEPVQGIVVEPGAHSGKQGAGIFLQLAHLLQRLG